MPNTRITGWRPVEPASPEPAQNRGAETSTSTASSGSALGPEVSRDFVAEWAGVPVDQRQLTPEQRDTLSYLRETMPTPVDPVVSDLSRYTDELLNRAQRVNRIVIDAEIRARENERRLEIDRWGTRPSEMQPWDNPYIPPRDTVRYRVDPTPARRAVPPRPTTEPAQLNTTIGGTQWNNVWVNDAVTTTIRDDVPSRDVPPAPRQNALPNTTRDMLVHRFKHCAITLDQLIDEVVAATIRV